MLISSPRQIRHLLRRPPRRLRRLRPPLPPNRQDLLRKPTDSDIRLRASGVSLSEDGSPAVVRVYQERRNVREDQAPRVANIRLDKLGSGDVDIPVAPR